ncbi:23999e7c-5a26-4a83-9afe-f22c6535a75b [Thermothielavioides terrestris]|uniref:Pre-rRNA-processing protein PNO1 n=1 Tax=Thermothielavioides terrestris TaxID=2587410 RepID=A0A3S4AR11_9PEZI|nr:23999e7c-5a26-4a83-9afe-f22c6535a75b [Thermothielavioides terrestris]
MPAPTALLQPAPAPEAPPAPATEQEDELLVDMQQSSAAGPSAAAPPPAAAEEDTDMAIDEEGRPRFAPGRDVDPVRRAETRKIPIPPNRIYPPLVDHCKLQVRMNVKEKRVELRSSRFTTSNEALQMGADFVSAFAMGFDIDDAIALLRLDSLYIQSFDIKDVRQTLGQDALSRAIGRIAGKDGKTKFAIENATKTRIVLAGSRVHILGAFENIGMARESIVSLVLGAQPGKVYNNLRIIASRMKERF